MFLILLFAFCYCGVMNRIETVELSPFVFIPSVLEYPVNSFLIQGADDSYVMVDCGQVEDYDVVKKIFLEKDIRYIVITHTHPDHVGCLQKLKEEFPEKLRFISHEAEARDLRMGLPTRSTLFFLSDYIFGEGVVVDETLRIEPDILFSEEKFDESVKAELVDNFGIELIHTPAHTKGSISVFCHTCGEGKGEVIIGDMLSKKAFSEDFDYHFFVLGEEALKREFVKILKMKPSKIYGSHYPRALESKEIIEKFELNESQIYGDEF